MQRPVRQIAAPYTCLSQLDGHRTTNQTEGFRYPNDVGNFVLTDLDDIAKCDITSERTGHFLATEWLSVGSCLQSLKDELPPAETPLAALKVKPLASGFPASLKGRATTHLLRRSTLKERAATGQRMPPAQRLSCHWLDAPSPNGATGFLGRLQPKEQRPATVLRDAQPQGRAVTWFETLCSPKKTSRHPGFLRRRSAAP
ncbi:hypothetical protein AVEN_144894-1 [Araneus ventricosus]|uniref:Uncharacterized protein n=1 Tax=Araneus ventricosus TaxID=182803 RepID=A0A4Y2EEY1_ARAVE|nr:hypothetical protein AVEN_144894-1 [Araneus ventricosus]